VELGWFIAGPVWRELKLWWSRRAELRLNRATTTTVLLAGAGLVLLLWPWHVTVRAPAAWGAATVQGLYAPYAAQVVAPLPMPGRRVRAGEVLTSLRAPDLQHRLDLASAREQQLQWQLAQQTLDGQLLEAGPALRKRWEAAAQEVAGLQREAERLQLAAPFDAVVVEAADDAQPQAWIPAGQKLLLLAGLAGTRVEAYVDEADLQDARAATQARFVAGDARGTTVDCRAVSADAVQLAQLDQPLVASVHGGAVAVQRQAEDRLVPVRPVFRVMLEDCSVTLPPGQELAGLVTLQGPRRSPAVAALRWAAARLRREAVLEH